MSIRKNNKYWTDRKINWITHYWNLDHPHRGMLIDILKTCKFSEVLEIGCASGANLYNIKKEFPDVKIAGCDISKDAIDTANVKFGEEYDNDKFNIPTIDGIAEIDFRVGGMENLPFNGMAFDMILTDACLIYSSKKNFHRVMREIRRVGSGRAQVMFLEFHHKSWFKRLALRIMSKGRYTAYDYRKMLEKYHFKGIRIFKISKEKWPGQPWEEYGNLILAYI